MSLEGRTESARAENKRKLISGFKRRNPIKGIERPNLMSGSSQENELRICWRISTFFLT